jgi:DNA ligase (NAD+)
MSRVPRALRDEAQALRRELETHDHLYYTLDSPRITDAEYDELFRRLQALEAAHPALCTPDSPTQRVGSAPLTHFETVTHRQPMLSLQNVTSLEELTEWHARVLRLLGREQLAYACEPKIDGVAIELVYEAGRLTVAATRGDGVVGENVTAAVRTIRQVPLRLRDQARPVPRLLEVRGEVFLPVEAFHRVNREREEAGEAPFANPRNATAGSLKQLDPRVTARRPLALACHGVGTIEGAEAGDDAGLAGHHALLAAFHDWGLPAVAHVVRAAGVDDVAAHFGRLEAARDTLPFEIDGLVVKVDDRELQDLLGQVSRSPRWAVAWKFKPRQATTRVERIVASVGRTGVLTPVAELEPVQVGGVTVRNVSLHNMDEVERKDVRVGDTILLERAGDVIPYVVKVLPERRRGDEQPFRMPATCPVCGSHVQRAEEEVAYRCLGLACPAKLKQAVRFYGSNQSRCFKGGQNF